MNYIKLIGIQIDNFSSVIVFEQNYNKNQESIFLVKKSDLERKGYICILANMNSDLTI